jgi:hypothetical protein
LPITNPQTILHPEGIGGKSIIYLQPLREKLLSVFACILPATFKEFITLALRTEFFRFARVRGYLHQKKSQASGKRINRITGKSMIFIAINNHPAYFNRKVMKQ